MGQSKTYANGQVLVSSALELSAINTVIYSLTLGMLGLPVVDNSALVRIEYAKEGQPFIPSPDVDTCFVRCMTQDGGYDKLRDVIEIVDPDDELKDKSDQRYTREWVIHWCFYGPNSTDNARAVRSALYQEYFTDQLAVANLFPESDFSIPVRVPENIDGQWFERVDFEAVMYEFIIESLLDNTVKSVEVKLNTPIGQVADFTVTAD